MTKLGSLFCNRVRFSGFTKEIIYKFGRKSDASNFHIFKMPSAAKISSSTMILNSSSEASPIRPNSQPSKWDWKIHWLPVVALVPLHGFGIYGLFLFSINYPTGAYLHALNVLTGIGVTVGAHRLWTHRSFKANLPLRILLASLFTLSGQRSIYTWAVEHRAHHKVRSKHVITCRNQGPTAQVKDDK